MALPSDVKESYVRIIDEILAGSDLNTVSEKRIRRGLQDATGNDLTPYKAEIKELIMQRFDIFADLAESGADMTAAVATGPAVPVTSVSAGPSSRKRSPDAESPSEGTERYPPQKKRKSDLIDADAAFAAKLQAEENSRARPTRAAKKAAPSKKKKPAAKSKTSKKVKASDDSELEGSGSEKKKEVNRSGGFHKPLNLSPALSALFDGEISLSRPQSVKRIWQYIHDHGLQDPSDRRQIRCDERMRAVFKQDRVHMFTMTKILNQNLYNPDE
ncbi:SWIB/MDM2 domain-containing protein [Coccidioides immitis RS]|uniref:SWIB/MDM2 domain-containing protein n=1 Tax=Coccidioides immitis (strain RS) TaxID=246410 RepID=J3K0I3_COCIM|nr:SWIB/MDM2 domain-containing protein [Coccidioides immitis RS]EAS27360.3 SWIB/MDM2 domain-containing protein [Coccidioides immitis RS]TPX20173.1 hypothetical protein DIZ76_016061 [Coccidioides immitis]